MVRGDETLLFLSDLDGEIETHLARLVENASPVLDAIFKHVEDAPAMPVADNPQRVITWLKSHVRKPLDTYCAYEASVQDIKACARAAGFTGKTQQSPLLIIMSFKSRLRAFALKLVGEALFHEKGKEALNSVGTVHFSDWVPFDNDHMGFFTVYDGDFEPYVQDFADKSTFVFDSCLSTCHWRAANLSSKERPGVLSVGIERKQSADRVLQCLSRPLGSRHSSPAGRSQVTTGHHSIAVVERRSIRSSALAKQNKTQGETRYEPKPSHD